MVSALLLLGVGFSVGAALLLVLAFAVSYRGLQLPWYSRIAGNVMLLGLLATQLQHAQFLLGRSPELATRQYALIIFVQSVGFYWLFLGLLRPAQQSWRVWEWCLPIAAIAAGTLVSLNAAIPFAMIGGTCAAVHLGSLVYRLRDQRRWFLLEFRVLALFAIMAVLIAALSVLTPWLGWHHFASVYSALITVSFAMVLHLLLRFPDIVNKTQEAVANSYAISTLSKIDCESAVKEIKRLFESEAIYQDENMNLARLAELTKLSSHQLSELINTQFKVGFSRLLRQYRVEAAKRMLIEEPKASVLSVGMAVGFSSQSNFYLAFKECTGVVPGQFRKRLGAVSAESL